jgi:predicted N-formylglutamate amidohydrolase
MPLLGADEPPAYQEVHSSGGSDFLIVVDHAGARVPAVLANLGVPQEELARHIAWDIGALAVARGVAESLGAALVSQTYSRLVIDCNRDPNVPSSIPRISELQEIPGNINLSAAQRAARRAEVFDPYHRRIRESIDARLAAGRRVVLVAQHTMTDVYKGVRRDMHAAVLYNRDRRFAGLVLEMLRRDGDLIVADNEPYFVSDETDYTIPHHAEARALPHVEIEIRQDLVGDDKGQTDWAARIARALQDALKEFDRIHPRGMTP